jgi:hypothetical protein
VDFHHFSHSAILDGAHRRSEADFRGLIRRCFPGLARLTCDARNPEARSLVCSSYRERLDNLKPRSR